MLDANLNRAREAARTLEDVARFGLDDQTLAAGFKHIRHTLRQAVEVAGVDPVQLMNSRDTESDVGVGNKTDAEFRRDGLAGIAAAAGPRLTEALRVIEETLKTLGPTAAGLIERARYDAYTLEQRLADRLSRPRRQWRLCVLLTAELCPGGDWERVAKAAIEGGADCLQLREKALDGGELLRRARVLVAIARPRGVSVIVNDRADVAAAADADGVHLGQTDLPVAEARRIVGPRRLIGVSTARIEEAHAAADADADSCGLGPMFPSGTKPKPTLAGPAYLRAYLDDPKARALPHLAISGIDAGRARELAALGCLGVAVSSAICAAEDPERATRAIATVMADGAPKPDHNPNP